MSSKLEELRRRIREQEAMEETHPWESAQPQPYTDPHRAEGERIPAAIGGGVAAAHGALTEAVEHIFEQTKAFGPRFEELSQAIDLIERLGESTARTFAPLKAFQTHLVYLVASFDAVRTFQSSLLELARSFSPIRPLQDELMKMTDAFEAELSRLIKTLEPAHDFRERILVLARSLDQANELLGELHELQSSLASSRPERTQERGPNDRADELLRMVGRSEREPEK